MAAIPDWMVRRFSPAEAARRDQSGLPQITFGNSSKVGTLVRTNGRPNQQHDQHGQIAPGFPGREIDAIPAARLAG
jgi:hypothetical protein